jgi:hypothetical protein
MTSAEPPTRARFLAAYRAELERADPDNPYPIHHDFLVRSMGMIIEHHAGFDEPLTDLMERAWSAIGGAGRVSLEKLRGLPDG